VGTEPASEGQVGPVTQAERIASLDVLRGFAVLGILVMNIQAFSMVWAAYVNPTAYGDFTGVNYAVWLVSHVLADRKFMTIFSMLFGGGIVLMTSRREATGQRAAGVHYRRVGVLLLLGLLHGYLLWDGDILYNYSMCGLVVYLFRRKRPRTLIVVGLMSIGVGSAISLLSHWSMPYWPPEQVDEMRESWWAPSEDTLAQELAAYRGGWVQQMPQRAAGAWFMQTFYFVIEGGWRAGGLMLVGMALFKLGVFSATRSRATYLVMIIVALLVGVPVILFGVQRNNAAGWEMERCMFLGGQFNYWASILIALGWVGLVMLVCQHGLMQALTRRLAAVGQMALSNYLLQTVICTMIFYGHGLGLFGRVQRVGQIGIVVAVWVVLLVISPLWLARYRFGPAEWLWRSLTYLRRQPMRRG
jgi:uncharacterized protein